MLKSEADTKLVDHVSTAFSIGGKKVEIDLCARGEDKPAVLSANGKVEAETVHVVFRFIDHDTWYHTKVPTMFVVFVDMTEFDGKDNGISLHRLFIFIIGGGCNVVASDVEMAVKEK